MLSRRFPVLFWFSVVAVSGVGACGGSTFSGTSSGGSGGSGATASGGSGAGTSGGSGGSGAKGGSSGSGATGGSGGSGCTACGPDGAPCCQEGVGCSAMGSPGSCSCKGGHWQCSSGTGGASGCGPDGNCGPGLTCCSGGCVNTANDIHNCGKCGNACGGAHPYCGYASGGTACSAPPCAVPKQPPAGEFCCGNTFCTSGQLCCMVEQGGPSSPYPKCITPSADQTTCPIGCPACA